MNDLLDSLIGKTICEIHTSDDLKKLYFRLEDESEYIMYHIQDCCEEVYIEDIEGDLNNLVGSPLVLAEESSRHKGDEEDIRIGVNHDAESYTWTFYRFATNKGYVTIRWYGYSNGYYSEAVNLTEIDDYIIEDKFLK